ncbi:MAG: LD-carboxypeptidase [Lachnospiraceae bacterium]|nr:LD-carboxypeptidase [Lachnospiraceae bacterium]
MRYPKFLEKNGTIGFVAPSFGCAIEPYKTGFIHAQKRFESMGYGLQLGPNCYAAEGIGISNTPEKCGRELTEYYVSDQNHVLLSCGGGELMCEILDHVDFEAVRKAPPKWYLGYSDNTNITFLLPTLCDTASIYGPCAPSFYTEPWHPSQQDAFGILTGDKVKGGRICVENYDGWEKESLKDAEHPLVPYHITEPFEMKAFVGEHMTDGPLKFEGRFLGGCVDCLVNLLGTSYDKVKEFGERYADDGVIWFLECCDLNVMGIRRAMWQMEHAGWFQRAKGFLIGRPLCYGQEMLGLDTYRAVTGILGKYHVPILMDVDLGHLPPMMPIVTGSYGKVTAAENKLSLEMILK